MPIDFVDATQFHERGPLRSHRLGPVLVVSMPSHLGARIRKEEFSLIF
jgi:hypothetical protein